VKKRRMAEPSTDVGAQTSSLQASARAVLREEVGPWGAALARQPASWASEGGLRSGFVASQPERCDGRAGVKPARPEVERRGA
jgi:hypothetical protein